jgi:hypothetical protein
LKRGAFVTTGAGALLAAGGDAIASCAGAPADADVASLYSHAEPIVGARPNRASAVPIKILFMDHLLSQWTKREICAHRQRLSMRTPDAALLQATPIPARVLTDSSRPDRLRSISDRGWMPRRFGARGRAWRPVS